jgi:hypothetical protein
MVELFFKLGSLEVVSNSGKLVVSKTEFLSGKSALRKNRFPFLVVEFIFSVLEFTDSTVGSEFGAVFGLVMDSELGFELE